jgi:hypothetical protein
MEKMTRPERDVFDALLEYSADYGGEFARASEVELEGLELNRQQFDALLDTLQEKQHIIIVDDAGSVAHRTDDGTLVVVRAVTDDACPTCGCVPGDGVTKGCTDPNGCGYWQNVQA